MLLAAAYRLGIEKEKVLERAGLTKAGLPAPEKRIAWEQLAPLVNAALDLTAEPGLGLLAGSLWQYPRCGLAGAYYANMETSRASQKFAYETLWPSLSNLVRFCHEECGEWVRNRGDLVAPEEPAAEVLVHIFLGIHLAGYRGLHGDRVEIDHVALRGTAIGSTERLSASLGVPVLSGQEGNWVAVTRELVDRPRPLSDPWLCEQLQPHMDAYLRSLEEGKETTRALRTVLERALADAMPVDLDHAAQGLALKPRTLRAKLAAEGTTFKGALDAVRRELALSYLTTPGTKLTDVAFRLGFSDYAAFTRAFRRWTGVTPSDWQEHSPRSNAPRPPSPGPGTPMLH